MTDIRTILGRTLSLALVFALAVQALAAQQPQPAIGSVRGQITDPNGAAIVAAKVTLIRATGGQRTVTTNEQGGYEIACPANQYTLRVEAEGFANYTSAQITVGAGDHVRHHVKLEVTIKQQEVKVDAGSRAPSVDPDRNGSAIVLKERDLD